jgi:DNA-binding NarL/FixJ family response regulator
MGRLNTRIEFLGADETLSTANLNHPPSATLLVQEAQILLLLGSGKKSLEIATELGTDEFAVKEHIKSILRKAMTSRGQARRRKGMETLSRGCLELGTPYTLAAE